MRAFDIRASQVPMGLPWSSCQLPGGVRRRGAQTCIHEVAKELPAGRHLKEGEPLLLSHPVQCCTGGHAASHPLHTPPLLALLSITASLRPDTSSGSATKQHMHKQCQPMQAMYLPTWCKAHASQVPCDKPETTIVLVSCFWTIGCWLDMSTGMDCRLPPVYLALPLMQAHACCTYQAVCATDPNSQTSLSTQTALTEQQQHLTHLQARLEVWDGISIGCDHGHRIRGRDEKLLAQNHVPVTIAVGSSSKVGAVVTPADVNQLLGIGQVGVGVAAPKVLFGNAIPAKTTYIVGRMDSV